MNIDMKLLFRITNILLIITLAYFTSNLLVLKFETVLESKTTETISVVSTKQSKNKAVPVASYNPILTRNIFNF